MPKTTPTRKGAGRRRVSQTTAKKPGARAGAKTAARRSPPSGAGRSRTAASSRSRSSASSTASRNRAASARSSASRNPSARSSASRSGAAPGRAAARSTGSRKDSPSSPSRNRSETSRSGGAASARDARPSLWRAMRDRIRFGLVRQPRDVMSLALIVSGLLAFLSFWGKAGPLGAWMLSTFRFLAGVWVYVSPAVLVGLGVVLLLGRFRDQYRRVFFGVLLTLVGSLALFHLMTGNVALAGNIEAVRERGGALGALLAFPLHRLMGFWGAFLVITALTMTGVLVVCRTSLGQVVRAAVELTSYMFKRLGQSREAFRQRLRPNPARYRQRPPAPAAQAHPPQAVRPQPPLQGYQAGHAGHPVANGQAKAPPAQDSAVTVTAQAAANPPKPPSPNGQVKGETSGEAAPAPKSAVAKSSKGYRLPPLKMLKRGASGGGPDRNMLEQTARQLENTLRQHQVDARLTNVVAGPTVTRYEIELAPGVKVSRVTNLSGDIAYAMATPDVRMLAPIPGRSAIGVEVPNPDRRLVTLGDVLASKEAKALTHPLTVGLGEDISGKPVLANLSELPHVLIAGATGAGKSSCINSIVTSLLVRTRPDDMRLIMVDPKRVELGQYNGVPHLLTKVITSPKKAVEALQWAVAEMDRRYDLLAEAGVRDIIGYQDKFDKKELPEEGFDRFPYLVVLIDELNDLMMVAGREVESAIVRIAQMARAVGIHLVIATQRPSVNVITGVIKANVPSRMAFAVASQTDSRVIIDSVGADKLVGMGDMLLVTAREPRPQRVQGAWVGEDEVRAVVKWSAEQREADYKKISEEVTAAKEEAAAAAAEEIDDEEAALVKQATELVVRSQLGSTSMLQRKLRIGFARAGRVMDILEQQGVVGPSEGSKAREVLMTAEDLETPAPA